MKIEKVHAVYFSPTGTTKTVITHLVKCITTLLPEVVTEVKDFTLPSGRKKVPDIRESELAIVGLPVYAGRLPNLLLNYLTTWQSNGAWAVPVVVYGNRSYGGGVPDIETVYPDVKSDQNLARDLIHRERQVEFAFENIRWFDANRWKIATETNHGKTYGMNVNISSKNALRSEYYQRTAFETRVFLERQYLQPIPQTAIMKNPDLKQNPGW